jgi:YD repeat-containing protein
LIENGRTVYRKNDLSGFLPVGRVESMALPGASYKQAFTAGLLEVFAPKASPGEVKSILGGDDGRYRDLDGNGPFWVPSGRIFYSTHIQDAAAQELMYAREHFFLPHRFEDPFGNTTHVDYDAKHNLIVVLTRDAAGNETTAELDYRVLQPKTVTDPNGNGALARFDALGMLAGTALCGKAEGPVEGDSFDDFVADLSPAQIAEYFSATDPYALAIAHLGSATTRVVYDFKRLPVCAATIARETHVSDLAPGEQTRVQLRFVYSDGFARLAQTRIQAEPGPLDPNDPHSPVLDPRWVAMAATIYDNKGNPIRQYEPFFSAAPEFGIEKWGVSNTLFYDPANRVVATLHPDHTFEKVVFDPWKRITFDANDTVTFDPRGDPDASEFFRRLPDSDYLPTWYQQRIGGARGPADRASAEKAAKNANTPSVGHFDCLGRTFLTIADNGRDSNGNEQLYRTRVVLDIEGNPLEVIDALGRVVLRSGYNMLSTGIHESSMEAGERWILDDVNGKPIHSWNSRNFTFRNEYDELRRPVKSFVHGGQPNGRDTQLLAREILFDRTIYGDSVETGLTEAERKQANVRGKVFRQFDGAGVLTTDLYDFKGNSLRSLRQFAEDYKGSPDWLGSPALESEIFSTSTAYDALNRAIAVTVPDGSIYRPTYNDASLLEAVNVNLRGAQEKGQPVWTPFVQHINYDAKGLRTIIRYANGAATAYEYDEKTFRLIRLETSRQAAGEGLASRIFKHARLVQDLRYTYDPVGNVTRIEDRAVETVFHANQRVDPACDYTYDALYRVIEATGRENVGQSTFDFDPPHSNDRDYPFVGAAQFADLQALRNYTERYGYDPVGNVLKMFHRTAGGGWTRAYAYDEASRIEPAKNSNRLSRTTLHASPLDRVEKYSYDANCRSLQT